MALKYLKRVVRFLEDNSNEVSMTTWIVVSWSGATKLISAYTESDARQQATVFCGDEGIKSFSLN